MMYEYNIYPEYNRYEFNKVVNLLKAKLKTIKETKYVEEPLDRDQLQTFITDKAKIVVKNDFMVGAVWVESDIELEL